MAGSHRLFTLETWKNWAKSGKAEVIQTIKQLLKEDPDNPGLSQPDVSKDLSRGLYEILSAVLRGNLTREHVRPLLAEMLNWHPDMASQLVEVATLLDLEASTIDRLGRNREQLMMLLKSLDIDKMMKERLEIETLGDYGIVKNKKNFHTKQIKVKTKLFYKQQKFNLLREETEGYAKLVTELNQDITERVTPQSIIQVIRSLIGGFNLDPNRVLDLILESLEARPSQHQFYTGLLNQYPCESATISELLGFKLNNHASNAKDAKGIYTTIALLIQANILQLSDIYSWLTPEDSSMIECHLKEESEAKEIVRKLNVISTKDKDKEKEKEQERQEEESVKEDFKNQEVYLSNQKIQLCIALIEVGAWEHFVEISSRFPDYYLMSFPPVSQALCQLVHATIEPIYRKVCNLPSRLKASPVKPLDNPLAPQPAESFGDVCSTVFPMLIVLGPHLFHDPGLMCKVLRVARVALKEAPGGEDGVRSNFYFEFLSVLDEVLLPSLSMLDSNPCLAEEIWETLKMYPYQHRYRLYGRWKNESFTQHPMLMRRRALLLKKAKFIMMRITKETIKPVSRGIGKLTHNNPGPIFHYILIQVQLYDNLIGPVVDSFKYLTSLSYDMLGYCIVEILSENKDRTAHEEMIISPWLQSLSSFCGTVFKKYVTDLGGILQFVANQVKSEKSIDLLILREIVQKMGGTDTLEDLTSEQLNAMCGGELLRREAGQYQQERNTKRSSLRLKEALLENDLAIPLLLLMAQQRSSIVYNQTESPHLKLVGKLYDQCQDTMVQFGSYLFQVVTIEELNDRLPSIGSLLSDYHINADVAFFLARPLFINMLNSRYDELRRQDRGEKKLTIEQKKDRYIQACNEVFEPIVSSIQPHFSIKVWEDMDPSFFLTFWTLTMSDLEVPHYMYEKEIKKIDANVSPSANKRKKETDRLLALKEKLQEEEKRQKEHVDRVYARLQQEKDGWFMLRGARSPKNDTVTAFLQLCLFPRCTFTALDAIYCAKFVKMLHNLKTPNFSTLICYDRMYCDITYTVASCTEQEAHRYGRFLLGTLDTVMHWHASQQNYEKECANYPGFVTKYRVSRQEANDYVDYENYRHVVHKWHYKITKALVTCLESGDYIQIRNAILILQGILQRFPVISNLAAVIEKRIEKVKNEERNRRNDLYVLANSYSGRLKAAKPNLMPETDFHIVPKRPQASKVVNGASEKSSSTTTNDVKSSGEVVEHNEKIVKMETSEATNGELEAKEDRDPKESKKESASKVSKEKKETSDKRRSEEREIKKEEKEKKDKEKKEEREEKPKKRSKESKKSKYEDEDYVDPERDDRALVGGGAERERESSVTSNASSASNKMEPPESSRGSKRRKTEHNSKSRKEEGSRREHKHKERSKSKEPEGETQTKESKKEKKERKRDRSQDDAADSDLKRKKEDRIKSNGRSEDDHKHRHQTHRADSEEYHDRYSSDIRGKDYREYEYERDYEKHPPSRHKRKN
ncbi:THO complex subunit 2-like [Penaeus japonicus]|uniref:THO complex subunit 2-like n=1 Tax=Penaeus japonicus TaxID=27405 RepID=UPI001C70B792|nr:THO complex subunit 2-like [Penaeus japonicus]